MVGILALAVGVMLSSSSTAVRSSRDRILYEEAYQAAVSGTHVARAWLIDPDMAHTQSGSGSIESDLKSLVDKAKTMNEQIIKDVKANKTSNLMGTSRFTAAGFSLGSQLPDGRYVLYTFPNNGGRVVNFINDPKNKKFTDNLFKGSPSGSLTNYVDMVRITTPGTDATTSASLRETTFIIEARGIAEYAGKKKTRVVQQRVLVYPNEPTAPLLSSGEAILTQGGLVIGGSSHANVHWAPVLAKSNIDMPFLQKITKSVSNKGVVNYTLDTKNGEKFNGAGVYTDDPNFKSNVMDSWLKWMAGTNGRLVARDGNLYANLPSSITDFFASAIKNTSDSSLPTKSNVILSGYYSSSGTSMNNPNGVYSTDNQGNTTGSLVERNPWVDQRVDSFFNEMNYAQLKAYAKSHNGYYYYNQNTSKLYDAAGTVVNQWPDMANQVSGSPFDSLNSNVSDRILFIDSYANKDSSAPTSPFSSAINLPTFWKGIVYVNGSVQGSGAGSSPDMIVRTPTQFKDFRENGSSSSYTIGRVVLDGILVCQGVASFQGNTAIYGTLAAKNGIDFVGTPSIFYNSANGEGRLKDDDSQVAEYRIIAGRMYETASN